jgi:hypothetical protein
VAQTVRQVPLNGGSGLDRSPVVIVLRGEFVEGYPCGKKRYSECSKVRSLPLFVTIIESDCSKL